MHISGFRDAACHCTVTLPQVLIQSPDCGVCGPQSWEPMLLHIFGDQLAFGNRERRRHSNVWVAFNIVDTKSKAEEHKDKSKFPCFGGRENAGSLPSSLSRTLMNAVPSTTSFEEIGRSEGNTGDMRSVKDVVYCLIMWAQILDIRVYLGVLFSCLGIVSFTLGFWYS